MSMQPWVRAQVHTVALPWPGPRSAATSLSRPVRRVVVIGEGQALARRPDAAEADRELVAVSRLARLAHRHDHAPPIGIATCNCRLDQWGVGDRQADAARALVAHGTCDCDLDEF